MGGARHRNREGSPGGGGRGATGSVSWAVSYPEVSRVPGHTRKCGAPSSEGRDEKCNRCFGEPCLPRPGGGLASQAEGRGRLLAPVCGSPCLWTAGGGSSARNGSRSGARLWIGVGGVSFAARHPRFPFPPGMCRWRPEETLLPRPPGDARRTWGTRSSPVRRRPETGTKGSPREMETWMAQVGRPCSRYLGSGGGGIRDRAVGSVCMSEE